MEYIANVEMAKTNTYCVNKIRHIEFGTSFCMKYRMAVPFVIVNAISDNYIEAMHACN